MATYEYKPGLGNAASFQVSGKPYVKGNVDASANPVIAFPSVTSWVVVHANNGDCKVLRLAGCSTHQSTFLDKVPDTFPIKSLKSSILLKLIFLRASKT